MSKRLKKILAILMSLTLVITLMVIKINAANILVNLTIDTDSVIQDDYLGVGGNFWGSCMSDEGIEYLGMNEAYLELNIKRIKTVQPAFMRVLVLPHYMVDYDDNHDGIIDENDTHKGELNWKNGIYDFETSYMRSFFTYLQAFKEAGTEIELNFGGSCSEYILEWFAIKDAPDDNFGTRSAPDDLEAFALAASALVSECFDRGFDNVTYINFYNESNMSNFGAYGDKRVYWCSMLKEVHERFVADGIRDKITILGSDTVAQHKWGHDARYSEWLSYINENAAGYFDLMSIHLYYGWDLSQSNQLSSVDDMFEIANKTVELYPDVMVTEYTLLDENKFEYSRAGQTIAHANAGVSASSIWFFMGSWIPEPASAFFGADPLNNLWGSPSKEGVDKVTTAFGEMGLLMRYIKNHSAIVRSESNNEDVRVATYVNDEDYTIVVEANASNKTRDLNIDLGVNTNKPFKKHVYIYPDDMDNSQYDANAILPPSEGEYTMTDGSFKDTIGKEHCLIVYTTLDDAEQIALNSVEQSVNVGGSVKFSVEKSYGLENNAVTWEVVVGGGTVDSTGKYTATGTSTGDVVAIKATPVEAEDEDAYAIAIVKIT